MSGPQLLIDSAINTEPLPRLEELSVCPDVADYRLESSRSGGACDNGERYGPVLRDGMTASFFPTLDSHSNSHPPHTFTAVDLNENHPLILVISLNFQMQPLPPRPVLHDWLIINDSIFPISTFNLECRLVFLELHEISTMYQTEQSV
jgi:hypothetical protein